MGRILKTVLSAILVIALLIPICAFSEGDSDQVVAAIPEEIVESFEEDASEEVLPVEESEPAEQTEELPPVEPEAEAEIAEEIPAEPVLPPVHALLEELGMDMEALAELTGFSVEELDAMSEADVAKLYLDIVNGEYAGEAEPVPAEILEAEDLPVEAGGDCGDNGNNVVWALADDGVLRISGTGNMQDYDAPEAAPWYNDYRDIITSVVIEEGVTGISRNAFAFCEKLESVTIARSVTSIGEGAFDGCGALTFNVYAVSFAEAYCLQKDLKYVLIESNGNKKYSMKSNNTIIFEVGEVSDLYAYVGLPATTLYGAKVTYSISNKKIFKVLDLYVDFDIDGYFFIKVKALKEGTATLKMTVKVGSKKYNFSSKIKVIDPYKPTGVKLNQTGTVKLNMGSTLRLYPTLQPSTAVADSITWKSSAKKYAKVDANGVVTPVAEGTATITVTVKRGSVKKTASVKIKVVDPYKPTGVKLDQTGTVLLSMGSYLRLNPTVQPSTARVDKYTWKSSSTKYAKVDANGVVTPVKEGTTTITVTATRGKIKKTAKVKVTVVDPYKPASVKLNPSGTVTLGLDSTLRLTPSVQPSTAIVDSCSWKSSATKYAKVDANGVVTPVKVGTATIIVTAKRGSIKKTASVKVKVVKAEPAPSPVTYRALMIGQVNFSFETATRNRGDVNLLSSAIKTVKGGEGNKYSITTKIDRTKSQVQSDIKNTFAGADGDDVSLFFYASHGVTDKGSNYGSLVTYNEEYITTAELTNWLSAIPGKVIVICGTCGSGALIQNSKGEAVDAFDPEAFNKAFIKAFAEADPGIVVQGDGEYENSAEMRQSKFYVLTAAAAGESSWGLEYQGRTKDGYNLFGKWLNEGIGTSGKMPADSNKNGALTLNELYTYLHNQDRKYAAESGNDQHTQVYPTNSSYVLFKR